MISVSADTRWNGAVVERFMAASKVNGVRVGYMDGERYPSGLPLGAVARTQEFGTPKIPPRPWIRPTLDAKKGLWAQAIAAGLKASAGDEAEIRRMWDARGGEIVACLRDGIDKANTPPLSAYTIARRQARGNSSTKPLVDTGAMRDKLSFRVAGEE